jgi:DNA-binding response OmpR family regulator
VKPFIADLGRDRRRFVMSAKRVLIVEDHEPTRRALRGLFRVRGYEVSTAGTVAEALASLDPPPSCIVLDLMLPDGRGEEVLRRVREAEMPTCVAVCTGVDDSARLKAIQRLRPDVFLVKPVDVDAILKTCEGRGAGGSGV